MTAAAILLLSAAVADVAMNPDLRGAWVPLTPEAAHWYAPAPPPVVRPSRAAVQVERATRGVEWMDAGGEFSLQADALPRSEIYELRSRLRASLTLDPAPWLRVHAEGVLDGLVGDRPDRVKDYDARAHAAWIELMWNDADLRAGYGTLTWGRLDEVQPSDVINPLEVRRFLTDGRSEARLPVPFVRGRVFPADGLSVEGVIVPRFERSPFDRLDEATSPFNLTNDLILPAGIALSSTEIELREPSVDWDDPFGGVRVSATAGRVDFSVATYRGADSFGLFVFEPDINAPPGPAVVGRLVQTFPRFTMYAGDFETVAGPWAFRGEAALFDDREILGVSRPGTVTGRVLDAGVGFDRRAGGARLYGTVFVHREWSDEDPGVDRREISLIGSIEGRAARDRHFLRAFAVVNPADRTSFLRGLWVWSVADNTTFDLSGGAFLGTGDDTLARFEGRDFVLARIRYHF